MASKAESLFTGAHFKCFSSLEEQLIYIHVRWGLNSLSHPVYRLFFGMDFFKK